MRKTKSRKGKSIFAWLGSASGSGAVAGAHNVCHALCQGAVFVAAFFGIALSSTALMFLEDYAVYFWTMGLIFLAISAYLFFVRNQGSQKLLLANAGILIAGAPFPQVQAYSTILLATGGLVVMLSVVLWLSERSGMKWTAKK